MYLDGNRRQEFARSASILASIVIIKMKTAQTSLPKWRKVVSYILNDKYWHGVEVQWCDDK